MRFLFHKDCGNEFIKIEGENFLHLKARRFGENKTIILKNLQDNYAYVYSCVEFSKRYCLLKFEEKYQENSEELFLHLALGVIEPKNIEKILPFLNELGVYKISLIYLDFSQKNFRLDLKRMEKIIIESCQQCGRNTLMHVEVFENLQKFSKAYEDIVLIDFDGEKLENFNPKDHVFLIGPEGGFSPNERKNISKKAKFNTAFILKTQSAAVALASKILI